MSSNNTSIQLENPGLTPFNYQCRGTDILLPNNIHAYSVSTSSLAPASMGIVIVHDIFGFKINKTRRFADILAAKSNANVLMPDFFQGDDPWPLEDFPAKDQGHFSKWLKKVSDWNYITQVGFVLYGFIRLHSVLLILGILFRFFLHRITTSKLFFPKIIEIRLVFWDFPGVVNKLCGHAVVRTTAT